MARIRSIKPEFWTSEQVVECSRDSRLLFIGMWNFCDDAGRHKASYLRLKMEVFPGDPVSTEQVRAWVRELIDNGLLIEYEVEGEEYWQITGWNHQKIDQPNIKHPSPDGTVEKSQRRLGGKQRQIAFRKLIERDGESCVSCGSKSNLAVDHIKPRAKGGTNDLANLQLLCKPCNNEKFTSDSKGTQQGTRKVRGGDAPPEGSRGEGKGEEGKGVESKGVEDTRDGDSSHSVWRWQPGQKTLSELIDRFSIPSVFVDETLSEFRIYWSSQEDRGGIYDAKFMKNVQSNWKSRGHSWQPSPTPQKNISDYGGFTVNDDTENPEESDS